MMPEHWIRLRGGWEWQPTARKGSGESPQRMTLPCSWSAETPPAVQLSRKFQAPRIDPSQEALFLRLERVAGLVQILLNGRLIGGPARGDEVMIVPLGEPLPPRNQLI